MTESIQSVTRSTANNRWPDYLENGDALTAHEFQRRYEAMPEIKKAELIEGIVYMGSPVRLAQHGQPDSLIQTWLGTYAAHTPGVQSAVNTTVRLDPDNVVQPDSLLRIVEECGGTSRLDTEGYIVGAPELIVEIAASRASIELRDKLRAYRRNRVREYLVWRTTENEFDWFVLSEDAYRPNPPDANGLIKSHVFPGLSLSMEALLGQEGAKVLSLLHENFRQSEHARWVEELVNRRLKI